VHSMDILWWIQFSLLATAIVLFGSYALIFGLADFYLKPQDLKKKYNAQWALVSGGSSGIGRALVEKLAKMGLNVVVVALEDDLLEKSYKQLTDTYRGVTFRKVGVNLGKVSDSYDYLKIIADATADIDVQIVFNNAGYIVMKSLAVTDAAPALANLECNVTSHVKVTHLFYQRMVQKKLKGCFCFTSSQAAFFPSPGGVLYSAGKAFISAYAASFAIEARPYGIDVCCLMPGPVRSNFYQNVPKLSVLNFFHMIASTPEQIAETFIRSVGHVVWRDANLYTYATRLATRIIDHNVLIETIAAVQPYVADMKLLNQK